MTKRLSKNEFVKKAKEIHGDKYNYDEFNYVNSATKSKIFCNSCQEYFEQTPNNHLSGQNCRTCARKNAFSTKKDFIKKAIKVHGDKYNYDEFSYINSATKSKIFCNSCQEFFTQTPNSHLVYGCKKCGIKRRSLTKKQFVDRALIVHNGKYKYNNFKYKNNYTEGEIYCIECNDVFFQRASHHLKGTGCPTCANNSKKLTQDEFIARAKEIHLDRYNYDNVKYVNISTKVRIYCTRCHKVFPQAPSEHLSGKGCPNCWVLDVRVSKEEFIKKAIKIHGEKYDYTNLKYVDTTTKANIYCKNCNIYFEQLPYTHLSGSGCNSCFLKKITRTTDEFIKQAIKIHGNKYGYDNVNYVNCYTKVKIYCKQCCIEFEQMPQGHLSGFGCQFCIHRPSMVSQIWLDSFKNQNIEREKYVNIDGKKMWLDGYDATTNTIYEFYGDFWHGNPELYNLSDMHPIAHKTYGELYYNTVERHERLELHGYNIIYIWENDWKKQFITKKTK